MNIVKKQEYKKPEISELNSDLTAVTGKVRGTTEMTATPGNSAMGPTPS